MTGRVRNSSVCDVNIQNTQPDAPTGNIKFGGKKDVAAMIGCCIRSVDNELQRGLPHMKMGARKVRFDLEEVAAWLKRTSGQQRIGKEGGQ